MITTDRTEPLRNLRLVFATSLLACLALVQTAHSGGGTFKDGKFNFCVSVRFEATPAQIAQIEAVFQNASQVIADATDGQHRFGRVIIVNDSGAPQSAEVWLRPGIGRANAQAGGYGVRGQHINLYAGLHLTGDAIVSGACPAAGPIGANGRAYDIAHEFAHQAYGVKDEYFGPAGAAECAPPPDIATLNFCLMDNFPCRGGRATGAGFTLNEFCVSSNHDPDTDTQQHATHMKSCWEVIAANAKFPSTAPMALPVDAPPAAQTVTFLPGFGGLRVMLVLARSGSMFGMRLFFAQAGAKVFVDFVKVGDALGVASFATTATVDFPLTEIVGPITQTAAKAAIDGLTAGGVTNIGGGLLAALGQITAQTDRSCNEIIVLLSDGDHNTGPTPASVVPMLQDEGVTVLTVGLGAGISAPGQAALQNVATQTGGRFFRVITALDLVGLFLTLSKESTGSGLLTRSPLLIAPFGEIETPVFLEENAESATFAIAIADATDEVVLSLRSPSGEEITEADAVGDPNIEFIADTNSQAFEIASPESGTWSIVVTSGDVATGVVEALAFADHDGVGLNVFVEDDTPVFPEPVKVRATPMFEGESVIGGTVSGIVSRPDGSQIPIELFDDGLDEHADGEAADGIYSVRFSQYNEDGTYTFELTVENVDGSTLPGEDFMFIGVPSNAQLVPPYVRMGSATAVVTGVPDDVVPPEVSCFVVPVADDDDDDDDDSGPDANLAIGIDAFDDSGVVFVSAIIDIGCDTIMVEDGQIIDLECEDDDDNSSENDSSENSSDDSNLDLDCEFEFDDGVLEIESDMAVLIVTATDLAGNVTVCELDLCAVLDDDDDDDDEDDDSDDDSSS